MSINLGKVQYYKSDYKINVLSIIKGKLYDVDKYLEEVKEISKHIKKIAEYLPENKGKT